MVDVDIHIIFGFQSSFYKSIIKIYAIYICIISISNERGLQVVVEGILNSNMYHPTAARYTFNEVYAIWRISFLFVVITDVQI